MTTPTHVPLTRIILTGAMFAGLALSAGCQLLYGDLDDPPDTPPVAPPDNPPDTPPDIPPNERPALPGCASITAESSYCMAIDGFVDHRLIMLGLDSGTTCGAVRAQAELLDTSSMAWIGEYVYVCPLDFGLTRIAIADGSVDSAPMPCDAVTAYDGGLLVMPFGGGPDAGTLLHFASFEDVVQDNRARTIQLDPFASRMTVSGERGYFAWHSTESVEVADLMDNAPFESISLEGYDGWIHGMAVLDDGRLVIGGPASNGNDDLFRFDADTGTALGAAGFSNLERLGGLACVSN